MMKEDRVVRYKQHYYAYIDVAQQFRAALILPNVRAVLGAIASRSLLQP